MPRVEQRASFAVTAVAIATLFTCLARVLDMMCGGAIGAPQVAALTIHAQPAHRAAAEGDPPRDVIVELHAGAAVVVREDAGAVWRVADGARLAERLRALKRERPERTYVVLRVDDGVAYERVVAVVDVAVGVGLAQVDVISTAANAAVPPSGAGPPSNGDQ